MHVTIIYATYSNSTALAAQHLVDCLKDSEHRVELLTAAEASAASLEQPDLLILASPSWDYNGQQGMPHEDFEALQQRLGDIHLDGKPTAVLALGDSNFTYFCGAAAHLSEWLQKLGAKEVVPPLKIDQYYTDENGAKEQIAGWIKALMVLATP